MEAPAAGKVEPSRLTFAFGHSPRKRQAATLPLAALGVPSQFCWEPPGKRPLGSPKGRAKRRYQVALGRDGAAEAESWETQLEGEDPFLDISLHLRDFSPCSPVGSVGPPLPSPYYSFLLLFYFLPLVSSPCFLTPSLVLAPNLSPLLVISMVDCVGTVTLHVLLRFHSWSGERRELQELPRRPPASLSRESYMFILWFEEIREILGV